MTTKIKSRGYSHALVTALVQGDGSLPWIELGRLCVAHDVPVATIAKQLGVSRQTVYMWFLNGNRPTPEHVDKINELIAEYHRANL